MILYDNLTMVIILIFNGLANNHKLTILSFSPSLKLYNSMIKQKKAKRSTFQTYGWDNYFDWRSCCCAL